jgi:hypothetical protein
MDKLIAKYKTTRNHQLKLKILTLSPFTIRKTSEKFETTSYMVSKARNLEKEFGILPEIPTMSKGKIIKRETKELIRNFYVLDEYSRQCPGMKDYKSCRNDEGIKVRIQKRLMLCNLKELYQEFVKIYTDQNDLIGFSTFAALRPPWCMLSGSSGTHSVCVCTYHQNPKLQVAALGIKGLNYKELLKASVCSMDNENCMMHLCSNCPREQGVKDTIEGLLSQNDVMPEEIRYKQWVTVDRCTIIEKIENANDFVEDLSLNIAKLSRHHYVSKAQAKYFKNLKDNLPEGEGCLVGDFAENYSFIVQDAAQGFHWENSQCTVHPFVFYWKDNNSVHHQSYCFISDCLKHNTNTVYTFQTKLIPRLLKQHPNFTKIHYFTDGCAGQYKNKSNFLNLCYHKEDFFIDAEWNFFATSHGKNACDGIGGTVKRATAKASLQRDINNQILTAQDMYKYLTEDLNSKIEYFYIPETYVKEIEYKSQNRQQLQVKPITGTLKLHRFIPLTNETIMVHYLSHGTGEERYIVGSKQNKSSTTVNANTDEIKIGSFIACRYENKLWFGLVKDFDDQYDDYIIKFLGQQGINASFTFPMNDDICPVAKEDILGMIDANVRGGTRIQYTFKEQDMHKFYTMVYR